MTKSTWVGLDVHQDSITATILRGDAVHLAQRAVTRPGSLPENEQVEPLSSA